MDHVADYKKPKEHGDEDEVTMMLREEGCAPKASPLANKELDKKPPPDRPSLVTGEFATNCDVIFTVKMPGNALFNCSYNFFISFFFFREWLVSSISGEFSDSLLKR